MIWEAADEDLSDFGVDEPTGRVRFGTAPTWCFSAEISFWEALREALS